MSGVILCSMQSKIPYYIKDLDINIYSIEELAYYLYHYVYLIDDDFFSEQLIEYIEKNLKHKRIASGLRQAKLHRSSLTEMISFVVKSSSFFTPDEMAKLQRELDILEHKSGIERMKARADILLKCKKYNNAFASYKYILMRSRGTNLSNEFYGNIYNNMGVICINMFKYENAVKYFREGYKISGKPTILRQLIMADLLLGEEENLENDMRSFKVTTAVKEQCETDLEKAQKTKEDKEKQTERNELSKAELEEETERWIHDYKSDN